jgi:MFS transporter, DHA1 family, staphyloferrin A biosynthesis exporter
MLMGIPHSPRTDAMTFISKATEILRNRTFSSFKNPAYRVFYGGMLGQVAAMNMQQVVGGLLVYSITKSSVVLGAMAFANAIPMLVFSLLGGFVADRVEKKWVLLLGQAAFALVSAGIALALITGYLSAAHPGSWHLLVISSAIQGCVMGLTMPSRSAIIPQIVPEDKLMNAISLNTLGMNVLQLFAPALAGFLVEAIDFQAVYLVMTATYAVAVVFFFLLPKTGATRSGQSNIFAGIRDGLKYVWHDRLILYVLLLSFVIVFLSTPYNSMLPVFVDENHLNVGPRGMGLMLSASAVGALMASLALTSLPGKKRGLAVILSGLGLGIVLIVFSLSRIWGLSLVLAGLIGLGQSVRMTISNTLLQEYVQDQYLGRVMSLYLMQFGLTSLSAFAAGIMTQSIGLNWAIGGFAALLVVGSLAVLAFVPRIRKLN